MRFTLSNQFVGLLRNGHRRPVLGVIAGTLAPNSVHTLELQVHKIDPARIGTPLKTKDSFSIFDPERTNSIETRLSVLALRPK